MTLAERDRLGRYEILESVGAGGMGEVYRARDRELMREVAVKVLPADAANDRERVRRFECESRAAAALNHPNILAVFDVGTYEGVPYIVTELLEGETLWERIRRGGLTVAKSVEYATYIAVGLAAAHRKGIIHRDLKTENLYLTTDGQIKILDFGLAKLIEPELDVVVGKEESDAPATPSGAMLGTAGYMAPEQVRGQPADERSDLFSLGVVLYEMISGRRPFKGATMGETMALILSQDPPALGPRVPVALQRIVNHCLEKRPEDRYAAAGELLAALEAVSERELMARNDEGNRVEGRFVCALRWGLDDIPLREGTNTIGRTPESDIQIASGKVSRRHAHIFVDSGRAMIEDLGSKNGTCVDGQRIQGPTELVDGDRVTIGPAEFHYCGLFTAETAPEDVPGIDVTED